ncbi:hypothetical protein EDD11_005970 [Mortierella claussenii]|nr:hypothetical protein EDD11_005970 [Mortierella claussenii]
MDTDPSSAPSSAPSSSSPRQQQQQLQQPSLRYPLDQAQEQEYRPHHLKHSNASLYSIAGTLPVEPLSPPSTLASAPKERYCFCLPVSSGIWVLSILLIIPSVALVLCFNVVNIRNIIQFNSPVQVKDFYTAIYTFYTLVGLGVGLLALRRIHLARRLQALIFLYWLLITVTIIEGVYFGIMMSKQKSKLVSYCEDGTIPSPTPSSSIAAGSHNSTTPTYEVTTTAKDVHLAVVCRKTKALIGVFYILGPGGWIVLHSAWILIVVLYSKALRRQQPVDEEKAMAKTASDDRTKGDNLFKKSAVASLKPMPTVFSSPWKQLVIDRKDVQDLDQGRSRTNARHDGDDSDEEDQEGMELQQIGPERARYAEGTDPTRPTMPTERKSWWMEQIEANRRHDISPERLQRSKLTSNLPQQY